MDKNSFLFALCLCLLLTSMQACEPMENSATRPTQEAPRPSPDTGATALAAEPDQAEAPRPYRPPDLSHITEARQRVTAQLEAFEKTMNPELLTYAVRSD